MKLKDYVSKWWWSLEEARRQSIIEHTKSFVITIVASFFLQLLLDWKAGGFLIPVNMAALISLIAGALRATIKFAVEPIIAWLRERLTKTG